MRQARRPDLATTIAAALCHRDEMLEDERIAPGEGFLDLADGVIFVGNHIVHEWTAVHDRTKNRRQCERIASAAQSGAACKSTKKKDPPERRVPECSELPQPWMI